MGLRLDDRFRHDGIRCVRFPNPALRVVIMADIFSVVDSSMLVNTSQQIDRWKQYFPMTQAGPDGSQEVADSWLGLMVNLFNIGSILSFFITSVFIRTS